MTLKYIDTHTHICTIHTWMYIYLWTYIIYIFMYVYKCFCVCVCVCVYISMLWVLNNFLTNFFDKGELFRIIIIEHLLLKNDLKMILEIIKATSTNLKLFLYFTSHWNIYLYIFFLDFYSYYYYQVLA